MYVPPSHKALLDTPFEVVGETSLSASELDLIVKFGSWLHGLSSGRIHPTTKEQARFVRMCRGQEQPCSELENAWNTYCLDQDFSRLLRVSSALGTRTTYAQFRSSMAKLARRGSLLAVAWLKKEGAWSEAPSEEQSPYAKSTFFAADAKILDTKPLPGSFGSRYDVGQGLIDDQS